MKRMASVVAFLRRDERGFEGDRMRVDRGDGGGEQGSGGDACKDESERAYALCQTCRRGEGVMWSKVLRSKATACPRLTVYMKQ